jgi:hypothetical protein
MGRDREQPKVRVHELQVQIWLHCVQEKSGMKEADETSYGL